MNYNTKNALEYQFSLILLIILVIVLFVTIALAYRKISPIHADNIDRDIPLFSVDVTFQPYPQTIDISNDKDCSAESLQTCDINDPTTVFGCRQLTARCIHFDKDVKYISVDRTAIIPKNKSDAEGYALSVGLISEDCNAYHGDMMLVSRTAVASEYMLVCVCKNPGYIGNDDIMGNCTDVKICNGSVEDLNQPLDKMQCKCPQTQTNFRYEDGLPVCRSLTVNEANNLFDDWSHLLTKRHDRYLEMKYFNKTIRANVKCDRLLNPCSNSIIDGSQIVGGTYSTHVNTCHFSDYGIPIVTDLLGSPADANDSERKIARIGGAINSKKWNNFRFSDNIDSKRGLCAITTTMIVPHFDSLSQSSLTFQLPTGIGYSKFSQIHPIYTTKKVLSPWCKIFPAGFFSFGHLMQCMLFYNYASDVDGIPIPLLNDIYQRDRMDDDELERYIKNVTLLQRSFEISYRTGLLINQKKFTEINDMQAYGYYIGYEQDGKARTTGVISFKDYEDYKLHKKVITAS